MRQRYELPAFNTVLRVARAARTEINQGYYAQVRARLPDAAKANLTALLARPAEGTQSSWDQLKNEPKQATTQHTRDFLEHLEWLRQQTIPTEVFADVPDIKVKQFAAEARSLDLGSIHDCADPKRLLAGLPGSGLLFVGSKGKMLTGYSGGKPMLLPERQFRGFEPRQKR